MCGDASAESSCAAVEGYEYVHPEIAAMLLTEAIQSSAPFEVNAHALTLLRRDGSKIATTHTLPMDLLASLADECDRTVFSSQTEWLNIPKKIAGLIHLSQFPTTSLQEQTVNGIFCNAEGLSGERGHNPAVLVASMVALNLLESSVREVALGYRASNKNSNKSNSSAGHDPPASRKGAPLLRDMIEQISGMHGVYLDRPLPAEHHGREIAASDLAPVLRALLLPTRMGGINLRNLVSHGFLSAIDRRWLSLTLVLMQTLDQLQASRIPTPTRDDVEESDCNRDGGIDVAKSSLRKYVPMESEVHRGKSILLADSRLRELELDFQALVPSTHMPLLRFSLHCLAPTLVPNLRAEDDRRLEGVDPIPAPSIPALTAVFATTLCCLLEHSLRLLWCQCNNRPNDCIARPATYYVTLDGHGQRDRHDVMIALYLSDERTKNQLIPVIGAQSCALLSDLFAAPSNEAPNIRSALFHGSWNGELLRELEGLTLCHERNDDRPERSNPLLVDSACALVSCMDMISTSLAGKSRNSQYRSVYSYTATAARSLTEARQYLAELDVLITNNSFIRNCTQAMKNEHAKLCSDLRPFRVELHDIKEMACNILPLLGSDDTTTFNVDSLYQEHETNLALASNVAALTLLADASQATKNYLAGLHERLNTLPTEPKNTKERRMVKAASRYFSAAMVARDFYAWSVVVALVAVRHGLHPQDALDKSCSRDDIVKASERSRMTLSTFDSYLAVNLERSLKALQQYLSGKAVKKVLLHVNETTLGGT